LQFAEFVQHFASKQILDLPAHAIEEDNKVFDDRLTIEFVQLALCFDLMLLLVIIELIRFV
jgi:hypothetical protein